MDRTWILRGHLCSRSYVDGIQGFMEFVRTKEGLNQDVYCPCQTCMNGVKMPQHTVEEHYTSMGWDAHMLGGFIMVNHMMIL